MGYRMPRCRWGILNLRLFPLYQALYEALYTNYIFKIFTILQLLASFLHS